MRGGFVLDGKMIRMRKCGKDVSSLLPGLDISAPFPWQCGIKKGWKKPLAANLHGTDVDRGE